MLELTPRAGRRRGAVRLRGPVLSESVLWRLRRV